jgi:ribosome-associated translation inhibitor RaiA
MIHIKFKNLEKSEMARSEAYDRVECIVEKFPDLGASHIHVTLEMLNSPTQAGPDLFKVKLHVLGGRYDGITLEKENSSLYAALSDVDEHILEMLNRFGDRTRVKERKNAQLILRRALVEPNSNETQALVPLQNFDHSQVE